MKELTTFLIFCVFARFCCVYSHRKSPPVKKPGCAFCSNRVLTSSVVFRSGSSMQRRPTQIYDPVSQRQRLCVMGGAQDGKIHLRMNAIILRQRSGSMPVKGSSSSRSFSAARRPGSGPVPPAAAFRRTVLSGAAWMRRPGRRPPATAWNFLLSGARLRSARRRSARAGADPPKRAGRCQPGASMVPPWAVSSPASRRSRVVLPHPEGPASAVMPSSGSSSEKWSG